MSATNRQVRVFHYDAFAEEPHQGNPAGVVFEADQLTDEQMQTVAQRVGFNETVFVLPSRVADVRLRYFTPGHEMNLCGHGTIGAFFGLQTRGLLGDSATMVDVTVETRAGVLPIRVTTANDRVLISMKQAAPQFMPFTDSRDDLAAAMGLTALDLDPGLPIVYGSTGTWTLLVPIRTLEAFSRMVPDNQRFPSVLTEMPRASVHPFCLETVDPAAHMHARHFSSPYSGTVEDAVTGTASGVMGAYYTEFVEQTPNLNLVVEQGLEIGRNGRVSVHVDRSHDRFDVSIAGTAVYVREFTV